MTDEVRKEIDEHGIELWFKGELLHREDGPAVITPDGEKHWIVNGLNHRIGGPAIIDELGREEWYVNGDLHRIDGPASNVFGIDEWWVRGEKILNQAHFQQVTKLSDEEISLLILKYGCIGKEKKSRFN